MFRTLNFGGDTAKVETEEWFCMLAEGWVDINWIDESILRETLEAGAATLQSKFNFNDWLSKIKATQKRGE